MIKSVEHLSSAKQGPICVGTNDAKRRHRPRYASASYRKGRTLHLVDAENLLGGAVFTCDEVRILSATYELASGYRPGDAVVVASSHMSAGPLWLGWDGDPRRLVRSGPDGADMELLSVLQHESPHERFGRVVVASGDGIFAEQCARLQARRCDVTIVAANDRSLSRALRLAVRDVRLLDQVFGNQVAPDFAIGPAA